MWFDVIRDRPQECRAKAHWDMVAQFSGRPWTDPATPDTPDAAYSMQQAAEALGAGTDTAAVASFLQPLVADAEPYSDLTLLIGADLARYFGKNDAAIALYEGALAKNPNIRDANYFLAFLYYGAKQADKIIPLADRLIALDPSNGDNYQMKALAYSLLADAEKDALLGGNAARFYKLPLAVPSADGQPAATGVRS